MPPSATAADHGPAHRLRPVLGPDKRMARPADVEVVEAQDPDHPKRRAIVRRAQVRDPVRAMVRAGRPYRLLLAAEAFRRDLARAEADAVPSQLRPRITVDGAQAGRGEGERASALDAQARVRRAWQAIGPTLAGVVSWCVVPKHQSQGTTYGAIRDYEQCKRLQHGRGAEMLEAALSRLADHYGLGAPDTPRDFA